MRMYQLAWQNVKNGLKNYLSLILSLAFTVMIFFNFQNMVYSDVLYAVGQHNKDYSDMIIQILTAVLGFFMIFFVGYATNVFLTRRKKEIGIYIFMGLTSQKIGRLYMLEMTMAGIVTLAAGIGAGILTTQLFQMILLAMSDIAVDIGFSFAWQPVLLTSAFYLAVYLFFISMDYRNIVTSSVLSMVSANRQNEYVRQGRGILMFRTVLGLAVLSAGYYMSVKEGGPEVLNNVLAAVVLVIAGVYFLFGGLIPMVFQGLAENKAFLYRRERNLWINQMVFRMKKNYRTYAVVCVLMLCSVTALAASFALKKRYEGILHFRSTYTYQLLSGRPDLDEQAQKLIEQENEIAFCTKIALLVPKQPEDAAQPDSAQPDSARPGGHPAGFLAWTPLKQLAQDAGLKFELSEPGDGEVIEIEHLYLLTLLTKSEDIEVEIAGRKFWQKGAVNEPYLGYLQENMSFYLVNDAEYEKLKLDAVQMYVYNYRIKDIYNYEASQEALRELSRSQKDSYAACIVTGPDSGGDMGWIKIFYSLCVFMVMVFIAASASILFMKLYNDAFEEQERYAILQKLGYSYQTLKRAASRELLAAYALPFLVMCVSSYFSVHALEKMMFASLTEIRLVSVGIIFIFFLLCYRLSVGIYLKNAGIRRK